MTDNNTSAKGRRSPRNRRERTSGASKHDLADTSFQELADLRDKLVQAARDRIKVRIAHDDAEGRGVAATVVSPYRMLVVSEPRWYLVGHSAAEGRVRVFELSAIREAVLTEESFRPPHGFSLDRFLGHAWCVARENRVWRVTIIFDPKVAREVAVHHWHKTQRMRRLPNGSLEFRATVDGLGEISRWLMGFGDRARVLAPQALRTLMAQTARRMLAIYEE